MKPLTQFEKMRANRARRTAIEREIQNQAEYQRYIQGFMERSQPNVYQDPVGALQHSLNNAGAPL